MCLTVTEQIGSMKSRMFRPLAYVLLAILVIAPRAEALERTHFELRTVGDFVALCDPPQSDADRWYGVVYCRGYLRGLGDFQRAFFRPAALGFCAPTPPPSVASVADAYAAWARANRAELTKPDIVDSLLRWAAQAYPCARAR